MDLTLLNFCAHLDSFCIYCLRSVEEISTSACLFSPLSILHVYVSRLLQAGENRTSVETEIKNSICSLIAELNKKGQVLLNQLEVQKPVSIKHPVICEKSNIRIFSSHDAALCTSSLICRQRCLFCPQALSEHPQAP